MVQCGADCCSLLNVGLLYVAADWCSLVQHGADWCNLVQFGAHWCTLVQLGAIWCQFVQLYHVIRIGQLSRDVIGRLSVTSKPRSYWL